MTGGFSVAWVAGAAEGGVGGLAARVPGGARSRDAGVGGSLLRSGGDGTFLTE